jgi:hypothetical protein
MGSLICQQCCQAGDKKHLPTQGMQMLKTINRVIEALNKMFRPPASAKNRLPARWLTCDEARSRGIFHRQSESSDAVIFI